MIEEVIQILENYVKSYFRNSRDLRNIDSLDKFMASKVGQNRLDICKIRGVVSIEDRIIGERGGIQKNIPL